jgi:hypothetical protein
MASAKPPVKHMPTAPTPLPPHSACAVRASARSQSTIGEARPARQALNSKRTHMPPSMVSMPAGCVAGRPGTPNSTGRKTVISASATRSAKRTTSGCRPGISWMTITAGPTPLR